LRYFGNADVFGGGVEYWQFPFFCKLRLVGEIRPPR
jgi:hypothetical protein